VRSKMFDSWRGNNTEYRQVLSCITKGNHALILL
jgi:hypothetical protein